MNSPAGSPLPGSSRRILVIDDEEIVLAGLRESLRREGYEVVTGSSALAGLEALKTGAFAVVMTDQQMPWMTGLEFLTQVKEVQPDASRILITAVLNLETVIEAINKGEIYRFIIKPWLREELLATVKNAFQRFDMLCRHAELEASTHAMNQRLGELNHSLEEQMAQVKRQNEQLLAFNEALEKNLRHSVQLCLHVMETFYPTLGTQARRVQEICRLTGESLNLSAHERVTLETSALLYDIGLVGVPREIIRRWQQEPASLSGPEWELIKQHPVTGQDVVQFVHDLEAVGRIIRSHHERFDGKGYPDGLAGEQIPWLSRLLTVAVTYAESRRESTEALHAIQLASGAAFDPDAVRCLMRVLPKASMPRKQRQVLLNELRPGMVPAHGIYTANGLLLIPEGQPLSAPAIEKVLNHNRIQPISQALVVYC